MKITKLTICLMTLFVFFGWWLAQLAASFPSIRGACCLLLLGQFIAIAIDGAIDMAKLKAKGHYGSILPVITPHTSVVIVLMFAVLLGIYTGWERWDKEKEGTDLVLQSQMKSLKVRE